MEKFLSAPGSQLSERVLIREDVHVPEKHVAHPYTASGHYPGRRRSYCNQPYLPLPGIHAGPGSGVHLETRCPHS